MWLYFPSDNDTYNKKQWAQAETYSLCIYLRWNFLEENFVNQPQKAVTQNSSTLNKNTRNQWDILLWTADELALVYGF